MSTLEKILGIAAVLVILIVFLIIMFVTIAYFTRWLEKGISPRNTFPRNPAGSKLSPQQQRALNVGAILAGNNRDFCDSLQTSKTMAMKNIKEMLTRDWEISSAEEALAQLESLKYNGHRRISNLILKNASPLLSSEPQVTLEPHKIYEQMGFAFLDPRVCEEYPNEVALVQKHMDLFDVFLNAASYEEVQKYQELFGDEQTFSCCIQIYYQFYAACRVYNQRTANLAQALKYLQEEGFLGTALSELEHLDTTAWDMGRMVNVARYSFDLGYISEDIAWEYLFTAYTESASRYSDWNEFAKAYIVGRALWGGENISLYNTVDTIKKLKKDKASPWLLASLH